MFKKAHVAALGTLLSPGLAAACGGLFCNNAQPVNQAAERVLFAHDGEQMQMHVRITYQGPPTEFGWLLPVPADVETGLSSETLFTQLDQTFAPVFQLNFEFEGENCFPDAGFPEGGAGGAGGEGGGGGGVQVLSREPVGPYDRSILQAESVDRLLEWLADNDYQVPPGSESTLQPYVDLGAAFVALKLLPGADAADIVPLRLSFSGNTPAVPIRPTAVAAEPDMGVIIQLLGPSRAVSTNYLHVQINEAAIDWAAGGANYADVVSQAADEAGGRAFATDFAGRHADVFFFGTLTPDVVEAISAAATLGDIMRFVDLSDPDVQRIMRSNLVPPEGLTVDDVLIFPFDFNDLPVDGAAIAAAINDEIIEVRAPIIALFERHPYLTRVFTTMSPAEMIDDPIFAFNPDLPDQGRTRTATQVVNCETNESYLRVGGQRVLRGEPIQRAGGETVRGVEQIGAALIERQYAAGQSDVVEDRRDQIGMGGAGGAGGAGAAGGAGGAGGTGGANNDAGLGQDGGDGGCDCDVSGGGPGLGVLLLGLLGLVRRRR